MQPGNEARTPSHAAETNAKVAGDMQSILRQVLCIFQPIDFSLPWAKSAHLLRLCAAPSHANLAKGSLEASPGLENSINPGNAICQSTFAFGQTSMSPP
jgi:hypothetical protein